MFSRVKKSELIEYQEKEKMVKIIKETVQEIIENKAKNMCLEIVTGMFGKKNKKRKSDDYSFDPYRLPILGTQFKRQVLASIENDIHKIIMDAVSNEEFIDSIIHRINKKQLHN